MRSNKRVLIPIIVLLLIVQGFLQRAFIYPLWKVNFSPNQPGIEAGLSGEQLLAALAGFRELVAGILWVRADGFFEQGNYDAILPMIRLVTWLDPKQIDVYATGMWHIAYNFTDEQSRQDRRYIPAAIALGREGTRNNPYTYELFFETGWIWYHRIDDQYDQAVQWMRQAVERDDIIPARRNMLTWALQRNGELEEALRYQYELLDRAEQAILRNDDPGTRGARDTIENNLDNMLVRMSQRGWFGRQKGLPSPVGYDTDPPFDVGFSARVTVIEPRVIRVEGTWNVRPVGTRIRFVLRDADFPHAIPGGMRYDWLDSVNLDPPTDQTFLQDQLFVRNQRFNRVIDMSSDPKMYPFLQDRYVIEFYYNPRSAPPHIQDKFSWNGEGMTDKNFLNTEIRPGTRVIYARLELTRDQILRRGEWAMNRRTPVVQTPNFVAPTRVNPNEDLIRVPGLRAE